MASSSTSSVPKSFEYDVFLSFRGEDTRKNFVSHLHYALKRESIATYKDDENMVRGERINDELIKAIEASRFYIIVFSKNYASSSWCLDELVKIMECQKTTDHTAYPVFYDVEPTEVRKQIGAVGKAFAKHKMNEDAGKWIEALQEAAGLAGFGLKDTANGHEAQFIQKIVEDISQKLDSINFSIDEDLVGMETRINDVVSSLETSFDDVRMLGIKGMGGCGKTTLAKEIFVKISSQFEGKSFVNNVREVSKSSSSGLKSLQEQILSNVLGTAITVNDVDLDGKRMMKTKMCNRKVLVVLDDVDHRDQLAALAEKNWFGPGSRIIITTRDEQVLIAHGVNLIRDINLLSDEEAICLFNKFAFRGESPIPRYKELSQQVVHYAAGLPLTIRVLGSNLKGKDVDEWKDTLESLKKIPLEETLEKLELSYIGLKRDHKDIFLDVACFWKGCRKDDAIEALECCQLHAKAGLSVLERKSLITVSKYGWLEMHDSIQEMGWDIVRRDHRDEPERCSRLWDAEEIENILANDLGSEATRGIQLWSSKLNLSIIMKGLKNMKKLRFLHVYIEGDFCRDYYDGSHRDGKNDEVSQYFPNALQYLYLGNYPFSSLPITFQASNLVGLYLSSSNLVQLLEGGERKVLPKLRFLEIFNSPLKTLDLGLTPDLDTLRITYCRHLVELQNLATCLNLKFLHINGSKLTTLDLDGALNLESLNLEECSDLVELQMLNECPKLTYLSLRCSKLTTLDLEGALNLETMRLSYCSDLVELQNLATCLKLKSIDIDHLYELTTLNLERTSNLETNLEGTQNLETLRVDCCFHLVDVQMPTKCRNLIFLHINNSKLTTLDLEGALNLETLYLRDYSNLVELQMPAECPKLKTLNLSGWKLKTLRLRTPNLESLNLEECSDLVVLHMPAECPKLKTLNVSGSKLKTLRLRTPNLESLNLEKCFDLVVLHMLDECPKLTHLSLRHSKLRTFNLMWTPNLEMLDLGGCYNLVKLDAPIGCLKKIIELNLRGCPRFENFDLFKKFVFSQVSVWPELKLIVKSIDICPLHPNDNNWPKFRFKWEYEGGPFYIENRELISVDLCACTEHEKFYESICDLRDLRKLELIGNIPEVPKDLGRLGSLEELMLSSTQIKHLPDSICSLQRLKFLKLESCWHLEKLPEDLGRLECLETLSLSDCIFLRDIPKSICKMKYLKYLHLSYCLSVKKLPEELGHVDSLKELRIEGTGISHLPQTIFLLKGVNIIGPDWLLRSCGLTPGKKITKYVSKCSI